MKVRVTYEAGDIRVDETFTGTGAEAVVSAMKTAVAIRAGFLVRLAVNAMSPLGFAREAVSRYNEARQKSLSLPNSCAEFIEIGRTEGLLTVLDP